MSETITASEVVETEYGEKVLLESPFEAKQYIKFLPWGDGDDPNYDELDSDTATPDFDFSDGFGAHTSADFQNGDFNGWLIDAEDLDEASDFFESVGFAFENNTSL